MAATGTVTASRMFEKDHTGTTTATVPVLMIAEAVLHAMNVKELQDQLRHCRRSTCGVKTVLQKRLKTALDTKAPYYTDIQLAEQKSQKKKETPKKKNTGIFKILPRQKRARTTTNTMNNAQPCRNRNNPGTTTITTMDLNRKAADEDDSSSSKTSHDGSFTNQKRAAIAAAATATNKKRAAIAAAAAATAAATATNKKRAAVAVSIAAAAAAATIPPTAAAGGNHAGSRTRVATMSHGLSLSPASLALVQPHRLRPWFNAEILRIGKNERNKTGHQKKKTKMLDQEKWELIWKILHHESTSYDDTICWSRELCDKSWTPNGRNATAGPSIITLSINIMWHTKNYTATRTVGKLFMIQWCLILFTGIMRRRVIGEDKKNYRNKSRNSITI